jgi:hypothetical protein
MFGQRKRRLPSFRYPARSTLTATRTSEGPTASVQSGGRNPVCGVPSKEAVVAGAAVGCRSAETASSGTSSKFSASAAAVRATAISVEGSSVSVSSASAVSGLGSAHSARRTSSSYSSIDTGKRVRIQPGLLTRTETATLSVAVSSSIERTVPAVAVPPAPCCSVSGISRPPRVGAEDSRGRPSRERQQIGTGSQLRGASGSATAPGSCPVGPSGSSARSFMSRHSSAPTGVPIGTFRSPVPGSGATGRAGGATGVADGPVPEP